MTIEGPRGDVWIINEEFRKTAKEIVDENSDEFSTIDLDKILFVECVGAVQHDWLGKCAKLAYYTKLIPRFVLENVFQGDVEQVEKYSRLLDIRYVISINRDDVYLIPGDTDEMVKIVLYHELKHIDPNMERIVKHNVMDFASILDKYGVHWTSGKIKSVDGEEESS